MGARTNFTFTTEAGSMTLYSHWGGDTKHSDLAHAIKAAMPRIKMGDTGYALRIMISNLIGPDWDSETGFGLYVGEEGGEEQYSPVTVNLVDGTINDNGNVVTFDNYLNYYGSALV